MEVTTSGGFALRDYQNEATNNVLDAFTQVQSALVVMPTGTGKTVLFCALGQHFVERSQRVLIIAHRDELIWQAARAWERTTGESPDIEMGDYIAKEKHFLYRRNCVVSSIQSLSRDNRLGRFDPGNFGLVIVDEAHHAPARSYRKVLSHFAQNPDLKILGVTATPDRADELALGQVFEQCAYDYEIVQAVEDGWLVSPDQQFIRVDDLDLSSVRTTAGDLNEGDLERIVLQEKNLHQIVYPTIEAAGDRPTLVFSVSVLHAQKMAEIFNRHEPGSADWLSGESSVERRREVVEEFKAGRLKRLCNCALFLEGFDAPITSCVAVARPTKSRALYAQMIGRGTRPLPGIVDDPAIAADAESRRERIALSGKPDLLILDYVGNSGRHKLVSAIDVLDGRYEDDVVEEAVRRAKESGDAKDVRKLLEEAEHALAAARQAKLRNVKPTVGWSAQKIDPFDLLGVSPRREPPWHQGRKPTERQLAALEKFGCEIKPGLTFTQAGALLDGLVKRIEAKQCTYKQAALLARFGYSTDVSFEEASDLITSLKNNGWKRRD